MCSAKFCVVPTEMIWTEVLQSRGTPSTSRSIKCVILIPFGGNLHFFVCSCTGCGTSKIYLCLEDNRSSFSQVSLRSDTKDPFPYIAVHSCLPKMWFLENKNLMSNSWRHKFIFDIKQLKKMNKFMKSICRLILGTLNATLEVPSLHPWLAQVKTGNASKNLVIEIRQIMYPLYQAKEITKKAYNNIMNSMTL